MKVAGSEAWVGLSLPAVPRPGDRILYSSGGSKIVIVTKVGMTDRVKSVMVYAVHPDTTEVMDG